MPEHILASPLISHTFSTGCTLLFYSLATLTGLFGMVMRKERFEKVACVFAALAFGFQTLSLALGFHKTFAEGLSGGAYLQLLAWFIALSALVLWLRIRKRTAFVLIAPLLTALYAMSIPFMEKPIVLPESFSASFYFLHMGSLFLSLALMAVAALVSILFLLLERSIKKKQRVSDFLRDMPALSVLDAINGFCIKGAFPFYSIGILTGLLRSNLAYGATFSGDPKEIFSLIIWALLAFVFHNRLASAWTGRKPALTMLCIFVLSLFSIFVINTLMHSHHTFLFN